MAITITGPANQILTTQDRQPLAPFTGLVVSDTDMASSYTITATDQFDASYTGIPLLIDGSHMGDGNQDMSSYQETVSSLADVQQALAAIQYTPSSHGVGYDGLSLTVKSAGSSATAYESVQNTSAPPPAPTIQFLVHDGVTGASSFSDEAEPYTGPVAGITSEYINITPHALSITSKIPNVFIHSGSGNDAIDVSQGGGTNVVDGSTGSNFLTGGSGDDTFFLDDRSPDASVFSTVVGFHSGDNVTVFGVNASDFAVHMFDGQGAQGYQGLDFSFTAPGHADANVVLSGYSSADLSNGRLTVTYGVTPDVGGVAGSQYMNVHGD